MLQRSQPLCTYLHPADVGANFVRPRATIRKGAIAPGNRPF